MLAMSARPACSCPGRLQGSVHDPQKGLATWSTAMALRTLQAQALTMAGEDCDLGTVVDATLKGCVSAQHGMWTLRCHCNKPPRIIGWPCVSHHVLWSKHPVKGARLTLGAPSVSLSSSADHQQRH